MRRHHEVALVVVAACAHAAPARPPEPEVTYTVRRVPGGLAVAIDAPAGAFSIHAWGGVDHPEASIDQVTATGALSHPDATTWRVSGHGRVTIRYVLTASELAESNRFRLLETDHFVHFLGNTTLLVPELEGEHRVRFVWEGFPDWRLASSHGTGAQVDFTGELDRFRDAVFFAGDGVRLVERPGITLALTGTWPFEDGALADRIAAIIGMERAFFSDPGPPHFVVTLLPLGHPGNYGGTGLTTSFSLVMGEGMPLDAGIDMLLAHEHFHSWCGQIIEPDPPEGEAYWFTEGFTTFYTSRLLYRAGMLSLADYASTLDRDLVAYTASSARELPNAQIGAGFWSVPDVEKIPYLRGELVAVALDAELRRIGRRSLDDVMRDLARERAHVTTETLLARFAAETSPAFADKLRATIVDGATLAIDARLLEPCLAAAIAKRPAFELGFDLGSVDSKILRGVVPGSAAEAAGVKNGDRLEAIDAQIGDPERPVRLGINGRTVTYRPARELEVLAFTVRDTSACANVLGGPVRASAR